MKGLELSRKFYEAYGKPMIEAEFGEFKDRIAVGLVGHGSECFGYDDDISSDHDLGPEFCIWITAEDEKNIGFKLFRAYSKLPKEFMGAKLKDTSLFGSGAHGVHTINEFYSQYIPSGGVPQSLDEWLCIPDFYLAEATNGEIFADPLGEFTRIRNAIINQCPEDVWLNKLASAVFNMAQSGQYNYSRCLAHGENAAAGLALSEFVRHCAHAVYLLNRRYMPYYKWAFKGMEALSILGELRQDLTELLKSPYAKEYNSKLIEEICSKCAGELRKQALSDKTCDYLEPYAYCIKNKIQDNILRNSPVMM